MSTGEGPERSLVALAERLQGICLGRGISIALAESCTGGRIASALTAVAGSSGYFLGGVVSYADAAKVELLGVPQHALDDHGAVSAQVARAMADGVRSRLGATLGAAVTGVAGPGGGSASKPVGLTYVAISDARGTDVRRLAFGAGRDENQRGAAAAVLEWLIDRAAAVADAETAASPTSRP